MKDFILLLVILMCIIGIGMWEISYLEETARYLKTDLNYVDYYLNKEKYISAYDSIEMLKSTWNNMKDTWAIFIHHDDIEYVELTIAEIESYIQEQEVSEARAAINRLISNIDFTTICEKINIENIF